MKPARPLLLVFGAIFLVGVLALALLRIPTIQRWLVLRATASVPGLTLKLTELSAGFSEVAVSGLEVSRNGLTVRVDRLEADYSLLQLIFRRRLCVHRLDTQGVLIDASKTFPPAVKGAVAGGPAAAPQVLSKVRLPLQIVLDDCTIQGRAVLPGIGSKLPVEAEYEISGGHFAPGQEGSLLFTATLRNPDTGAQVVALHAQASLRVTQTSTRSFSRVALTAVVDAEGKNISEQTQLKVSGELNRGNQVENYALNVDSLIHGQAEKLLAIHATLPAGQAEFSGEWNLKARTAQLEPFFLGAPLPDFTAHGEGRFSFAPATGEIGLKGMLEADARRLEAIRPAWVAFGTVKLQAQFDAAEANHVARIRTLDVQLAGDRPVLTAHALQAAEYNFDDRRLRLAGSSSADVVNLKLHGLPVGWVQPFSPGLVISGGTITGNLAIAAEKERLLVRISEPLRVDELNLLRDGTPLLNKGDVSLKAEAVIDRQQVNVSVAELSLKTPMGDTATIHGSVSVPTSPRPRTTLSASYTFDLPQLLAAWVPGREVKSTGDLEISFSADALEFRNFATKVTDGNGQPMFAASLLRSFALDLNSGRVSAGNFNTADLAGFALTGLPLNCLPVVQPGTTLGGAVAQGDFLLTMTRDKITFHPVNAVKLTGFSLTQNGRPALSGLAIEAHPVVEWTGGNSLNVQTGDVGIRTDADAPLLTLKGEFTHAPTTGLRGNASFTVEVPALATQPIFAGADAVSEGRASGEIRALVSRDSQVEARITVNGLVARNGGQLLPVANVSFRGAVEENGHVSIQVPFLLDRAGQRSDLNCSFDLTPVGRGFQLDGKLAGEHIELADALSVLAVFSPDVADAEQPATPAAATPASVAADAEPAWSRFKGQLAIDLKAATAGKTWSMTGLNGVITVDPSHVALQKLAATFGDKSRLEAKADLNFTAAAKPYQFAGDFSLTEFDVGNFFKALDATKPPTVEGTFTVAGHFSGAGETVERTAQRTYGNFELTSRQGVFRGLQRTTSKVSMGSKAVELGASVLGSFLGTDKATRAAEKVAGLSYFVDQLAQGVSEFNYDQFSVKLVRAESLNMTLEDINLVAPEVRLAGTGEVTYVAGKSLLDQPLAASLALSGKGKMEQMLGKVRLLDGTRDELGFARTKEPVSLGGTLAKPDPNAFFLKVATAKLGELLNPDKAPEKTPDKTPDN